VDMIYCHGCGKQLHKTAPSCPGCGAPQQAAQPVRGGATANASTNWYLVVLKKYATFSGRARRKEYWYYTLFSLIIYVALSAIGAVVGVKDVLGSLYSLAVAIPGIAVGVRRLHDTGRSGWWLLLPIVNIIFLAQDGQAGSNNYGDDPKTH
jgi:uncharacterized membrane protein YhaH (DUF805 family)